MRVYVLRDTARADIVHNVLIVHNNGVTRHMIQQKIMDIVDNMESDGHEWFIREVVEAMPEAWGVFLAGGDFDSIASIYI